MPAQRLTTAEVLARLQVSRATLHRMMKAGDFPKPVRRGRWLGAAVERAMGRTSDLRTEEDDDYRSRVEPARSRTRRPGGATGRKRGKVTQTLRAGAAARSVKIASFAVLPCATDLV